MSSKYSWDDTTKPKQAPIWNNGDSLGVKIEKMFTRWMQGAFLWAVDFISDRLVDIFDNSMKIMRPGTERATKDILDYLKTLEGAPEWFAQAMQSVENEKGESSFLLRLVVFISAVRSIIIGGIQPITNFINYNAEKKFRSFLPDVNTTAFMHRAGIMSDEGFRDTFAKLGVNDRLSPAIEELSRRLPGVQELSMGLWRGVVDSSKFTQELRRMGYDGDTTKLYEELLKQIPPLQDLIRMLVRDAFNDAASSQYGYDEDYPEEINQYFVKQGYDSDWAKRYWRSHWQLPSPMQAYEMLHRSLIDVNDLETLLRISDYPKFWRDKLRDISYNVLTRVDVRRLLQAGIIDAGKALDTYKKMGYTPEDAQLLTDFAVAGISNEEKDLTKTDILNLYEEGLLDRDTVAGNLVKMGYDGDEAENILKLADVNIAKSIRTDLINYSKEKFIAHLIDEQGARSELTQAGLKSQSVERYVMNWKRAQETDVTIPPIGDVKRWYLGDYIDETKARAFLAQLKHSADNIEIYVKEWNDIKGLQANEQA